MKVERRIVAAPLETRKADDDAARMLTGYAAVFNREAVIAGLFREQIAPGAFTTTIQEDDVRALFNHNPNYVLGRNTTGTLRLSEDDTGLRYEVDPPETQWARDLMVSVERGDVSQSSFGFEVMEEKWLEPDKKTTELPLRTILKARLWDVSPVTYPAYEDTIAEARSQAEAIVRAQEARVIAAELAGQAAMALRLRRQRAITVSVEG